MSQQLARSVGSLPRRVRPESGVKPTCQDDVVGVCFDSVPRGAALHSASALSKAGLGNLVARMYVFFATFSREAAAYLRQ